MQLSLTRRSINCCNVWRIFGKHDGKASFEMPINMTMEEPGSGVVRLKQEMNFSCQRRPFRQHQKLHCVRTYRKTNCHIVARTSNVDNVALHRVNIIVCRAAGTANDRESVLETTLRCQQDCANRVIVSATSTHPMQVEGVTTTDDSPGQRELDAGIVRQGVHATSRQQILSILSATQDLEKDRDSGRDKCKAVDQETGSILRGAVVRILQSY